MKIRTSIAALVVLAATASWGQNSAGPMASSRSTMTASPNSDAQMAAARAKAQLEAKQHIEELGATLTKMHGLLKQMKAKAAAAPSKDSSAKANVELWSMMLEQLDKQYDQMITVEKAREDMEARRLALYKQADEKAAAAAAAGRAAQQAKIAAEQANANSPSTAGTASQPAVAPAAAPSTSTPAAAPAATSSPN